MATFNFCTTTTPSNTIWNFYICVPNNKCMDSVIIPSKFVLKKQYGNLSMALYEISVRAVQISLTSAPRNVYPSLQLYSAIMTVLYGQTFNAIVTSKSVLKIILICVLTPCKYSHFLFCKKFLLWVSLSFFLQ